MDDVFLCFIILGWALILSLSPLQDNSNVKKQEFKLQMKEWEARLRNLNFKGKNGMQAHEQRNQ